MRYEGGKFRTTFDQPSLYRLDSWEPCRLRVSTLCLHGSGLPEEFPAGSLALSDGNAWLTEERDISIGDLHVLCRIVTLMENTGE